MPLLCWDSWPYATRMNVSSARTKTLAKTLYDSEEALYNYAIRTLTKQMRTVAQLKRLLRTHTPPGEQGAGWIEAVVARLKNQGYLSDQNYAEIYTRVRQTQKKLGQRRITQDLQSKGIHESVAQQAVAQAFADVNETEQLQAFLQRKRVPVPETQKDMARVLRMLQRAGFGLGVSLTWLRSWQRKEHSEKERTDVE